MRPRLINVLLSISLFLASVHGFDEAERTVSQKLNYRLPSWEYQKVSRGKANDEEKYPLCKARIEASDSNGDGVLDQEEFLSFIFLSLGTTVPDGYTWLDLPIGIIAIFNSVFDDSLDGVDITDEAKTNKMCKRVKNRLDKLMNRPSASPTLSMAPTISPSIEVTEMPSALPTSSPTLPSSSIPSTSSSERPSNFPTLFLSHKPVQSSSYPSGSPSSFPSLLSTDKPSSQPSSIPTFQLSNHPSGSPSSFPSLLSTDKPSSQPSSIPTLQPSNHPSGSPSTSPTSFPTDEPSSQPSSIPTLQPSNHPSGSPSASPTSFPTDKPSSQTSSIPTLQPSNHPSGSPSIFPTLISKPSSQPLMPSDGPSHMPLESPSAFQSQEPSIEASALPTMTSDIPVNAPTLHPSILSQIPSTLTSLPSLQPSEDGSKETSNPSSSVIPVTLIFRFPLSTTSSIDSDRVLNQANNTVLVDLQTAILESVNNAINDFNHSCHIEPHLDESDEGEVIKAVDNVYCDVDDYEYALSSDINCSIVTSHINMYTYCDNDEGPLKEVVSTELRRSLLRRKWC